MYLRIGKLKKKTNIYKVIALLMIITLGYIQTIQFAHISHSPASKTESVKESSHLANNNDVSCLICYYLQHSHAQHIYYSTYTFSLSYEPLLTVLYVNNSYETLLSFLKKSNNKSPPLQEFFS